MSEVIIYVVNQVKDPDNMGDGSVPWAFKSHIFFGPCKKSLRKKLRERYLSENNTNHQITNEQIYIVGVNASNCQKERKIIWAGKLDRVMTFQEGYLFLDKMKDEEVRKMMGRLNSHMHVEPISDKNNYLTGYKKRSEFHLMEEWKADFINPNSQLYKDIQSHDANPETLLIPPQSESWNKNNIDCCMWLEKVFWANEKGIGINDRNKLLEIMKNVPEALNKHDQHPRKKITSYCIFGEDSAGKANGLRGSYLSIDGDQAQYFIAQLRSEAKKIQPKQRISCEKTIKTGSCRQK